MWIITDIQYGQTYYDGRHIIDLNNVCPGVRYYSNVSPIVITYSFIVFETKEEAEIRYVQMLEEAPDVYLYADHIRLLQQIQNPDLQARIKAILNKHSKKEI